MKPTAYETTIHGIDPTINPVGVECSMRLAHGALDNLPREAFLDETALARTCERERPGYLQAVAASYGATKRFDAWQARLQAD